LARLVERALRGPLLQVAIDLNDLAKAVGVAIGARRGGAHVVEVGTPLLKSWGMMAVDVVKKVVGDGLLLVDTKTADAVRIEVEPLARAGADAFTVLGFVSREVIEEALATGSELGVDVVVDLIHIENPVDRALRLADLGVKVFELHVGVDVQKRRGVDASTLLREVEELSRTGLVVAVAGGIRPDSAGTFVRAGARIVIIGGAIYRAEDPEAETRRALESIAKALG